MYSRTGQTTLEYIFSSAIVPNAMYYNGLVELVVNGISDQYLDFYDNSGTAEVFLYCGGSAAWCTTEDRTQPNGITPAAIDDVTLNPDTMPFSATTPSTRDAALYTPGSGPGDSTYNGQTTSYSILFNSNSDLAPVPEPTSVMLFGAVLLVSLFARKKLVG